MTYYEERNVENREEIWVGWKKMIQRNPVKRERDPEVVERS